ncbi:MAG: acetylxylan esterase [Paracoccaceae bacterium]|jgi:cephalosporin-C deacetylase
MPFPDLIHPDLAAYRSDVSAPADLDRFWQSTLAEARAAKGEVILQPSATTLRAVEVFDVTFPGFGGHPVKGWLILPRHRTGRLPLVVQFVGYGGGRGLPHEELHWAASGFAHFKMDTRGQGSARSVGDMPDPGGSTPAFPGFMTRGALDKADYYYRRVYTDGVRAVDAMLAQDFIDPDRITLCGGSQGGGTTLAVGGAGPSGRGHPARRALPVRFSRRAADGGAESLSGNRALPRAAPRS